MDFHVVRKILSKTAVKRCINLRRCRFDFLNIQHHMQQSYGQCQSDYQYIANCGADATNIFVISMFGQLR